MPSLLDTLVHQAIDTTGSTDVAVVTIKVLHGLSQSQKDTLLRQAIAEQLEAAVQEVRSPLIAVSAAA